MTVPLTDTARLAESRRTVRPGANVTVPGLAGRFEVVDATDRALLTLRSETGADLRVGRLAVSLAEGAE